MLSFKEVILLKEQLLLEAYDYKQMFSKVISLSEDDFSGDWANKKADEFIAVAQETLKKNFRIIWFLKFVQWFLARNIINSSPESKVYYNKILNDISKNTSISPIDVERQLINYNTPRGLITQYQHYLDLKIDAITDFNPQGKIPSEVFSYFDKLEKEWSAELEGAIKYTDQPLVDEPPEQQHGYASHINREDYCLDIIDFGDGWHWVDLNTSICDKEAQALGHCGNSGNSGSTLLSLRYLNKRRKEVDSWVWEPHVTFELESDNMLGQMKGKNNDKPSPKYHERIMALLTHKVTMSSKGDKGFLIRGLRGGGYRPETNFSLGDLTEEQADQVIKENPNLDITNLIVEKYGDRVTIKGDYITISKFPLYSKTVLCLADLYQTGSRRDGVSEATVNEICSDGYMDISHWDIGYKNIRTIFTDVTVSKANEEKIIAFLDNEYPDWKEDDDNWEEYLEQNDTEVNDLLQRAYLYAEETASQDAVMDDFYKSVDGSDYLTFNNWDEGFSMTFNKKKNINLLQNLAEHDDPNSQDSYEDKEVFWTWDEPRYGWYGSVKDDIFNDQLDQIIDEL